MTQVERIADFATRASFDLLSSRARDQVKIRILDSLGCAIGAFDGEPIRKLRQFVNEFAGIGRCTLIGGGSAQPDLAAFYNAALVRYLDFNDSYLAKGETCHPSDNLGALLAAGEYAGASGPELMTALALAYQVQCRLSDEAPVRARGFDHTVQGAYGATAAIGKIFWLDRRELANAIAISGAALNALRATRTGALSNWKGLAFPHMSSDCVRNAFLARTGITGPLEVIEGEKGLMDAITGLFDIDWTSEDLERITRTVLKKYNAEIHSQTTIEAVLQLMREHHISTDGIDHIDVKVFEVAYNIIGGGEEGDKHTVRNKEQADHSLPYLVSVAVLDDQVMPEQYAPERIIRSDLQKLIGRVAVHPDAAYSERFPDEMPSQVTITLGDGRVLQREVRSCEGSRNLPMSWDAAYRKFEKLAAPYTTKDQREQIAHTIATFDQHTVGELMALLARVGVPQHSSQPVLTMGRR